MNRQFWVNKRVLVTGHTGFKGSWLAFWLSQMGAVVEGYALAPNQNPNMFSALGLENQLGHNTGDVRDLVSLSKIVSNFKPEIVFHLAAQPLVRRSYHEPIDTYSTNVMGTVNLLESCRGQENIGAIVVITTDKCYKNNEWEWPYREVDVLGGHDPYSNSKACAELVTECYRNSYFSKTSRTVLCSARAGNVVGGGDWSEDRIVPDIIRSISLNRPIKIRCPNAVRPWQHVLDSLNGYLMLAEKAYDNAIISGAFNFGPNHYQSVTVADILGRFKESFGERLGIVIEDGPKVHEAGLLKLDSSKATKELGWRPTLSLEDTVEWTVNWYSDFLENPKCGTSLTESQISEFERLNEGRRA